MLTICKRAYIRLRVMHLAVMGNTHESGMEPLYESFMQNAFALCVTVTFFMDLSGMSRN